MRIYIYPYRVSVVRERTDRYERIERSNDVKNIVRQLLTAAPTERVLMFMLNAKNRIMGFVEKISIKKGGEPHGKNNDSAKSPAI